MLRPLVLLGPFPYAVFLSGNAPRRLAAFYDSPQEQSLNRRTNQNSGTFPVIPKKGISYAVDIEPEICS